MAKIAKIIINEDHTIHIETGGFSSVEIAQALDAVLTAICEKSMNGNKIKAWQMRDDITKANNSTNGNIIMP
jgi:hypothetical protein